MGLKHASIPLLLQILISMKWFTFSHTPWSPFQHKAELAILEWLYSIDHKSLVPLITHLSIHALQLRYHSSPWKNSWCLCLGSSTYMEIFRKLTFYRAGTYSWFLSCSFPFNHDQAVEAQYYLSRQLNRHSWHPADWSYLLFYSYSD